MTPHGGAHHSSEAAAGREGGNERPTLGRGLCKSVSPSTSPFMSLWGYLPPGGPGFWSALGLRRRDQPREYCV